MPFNAKGFEKANFEARTKSVSVEALADFFNEGEKPEFLVRGLSSNELHRAMNAQKTQASIDNLLTAIAEGKDSADAVRKVLGYSKDTPAEVAKRMEMLVSGCVEPKMTMPLAVKLAENFPIEFLALTNVITELTGQGYEYVKRNAVSQKTKASEPA